MEQEFVDILDVSAAAGESIEALHRRKEHGLRGLFGRLTATEARVWRHRLSTVSEDDEIATRFARLAHDRKDRLLAFLADARRRESMAAPHRQPGAPQGSR